MSFWSNQLIQNGLCELSEEFQGWIRDHPPVWRGNSSLEGHYVKASGLCLEWFFVFITGDSSSSMAQPAVPKSWLPGFHRRQRARRVFCHEVGETEFYCGSWVGAKSMERFIGCISRSEKFSLTPVILNQRFLWKLLKSRCWVFGYSLFHHCSWKMMPL